MIEAIQHGDLVSAGVHLAKYVLVIFSIVAVGVVVERLFYLARARKLEERDFVVLRDALTKGDLATASTVAAASAAPVAAALEAGLEQQQLGSGGKTSANSGVLQRIRDAMDQEVAVQVALLQRNLQLLATCASTAPYVGLFGTVLGILQAFDRIARLNQTGASVVAAPIAEALKATALGLGVAIPAVMAYNYFSGRVKGLGLLIETHSLDLNSRLEAALENEEAQTVGGENHGG